MTGVLCACSNETVPSQTPPHLATKPLAREVWSVATEAAVSYRVVRDSARGVRSVAVSDRLVATARYGSRSVSVVDRMSGAERNLRLVTPAGTALFPRYVGAYAGDSIYVYSTEPGDSDWITILGFEGAVARQFQLPTNSNRIPPKAFPDGRFLVAVAAGGAPQLSTHRIRRSDMSELRMYSAEGSLERKVATRITGYLWYNDAGVRRADWFFPRADLEVGPGAFYYFFPEQYSYEVHGLAHGTSKWNGRVATPARIEQHHIQALLDAARTPPEWEEQVRAEFAAEAALVETLPSYETRGLTSPLVDLNGNVWIPRYAGGLEARSMRWDVFDVDGSWLLTLDSPPGFAITHVSDTTVVGVLRVSDFEDRVQVRPLRKDAHSLAPH